MAKKFPKSLNKAWRQYQDLYDRYMGLLRLCGSCLDIEDVRDAYQAQIEYAMEEWSTPQERWENDCFDDVDLE